MNGATMDTAKAPAHVVWGAIDQSESSGSSATPGRQVNTTADVHFKPFDSSSSFACDSSAEAEHLSELSQGQAGGPLTTVTPAAAAAAAAACGPEAKVTVELLQTMVDDSIVDLVWSKGSECHPEGCMPCYHHQTARGCPKGHECTYCHMPHTTSSGKVRPGSVQRTLCKKVADSLEARTGGNRDAIIKACALLGATSPYLRRTILGRLDPSLVEDDNAGSPATPSTGQGKGKLLLSL